MAAVGRRCCCISLRPDVLMHNQSTSVGSRRHSHSNYVWFCNCSCEDMVQISAMECVLSGSQMVTDLRLTEAIQFSVETQFTWETNPPSITSNSEIKVLA